MKKSIYLLCFLFLNCNGCAVLSSREAAAGCQIADMATTERALKLNPNAEEQNTIPVPLLFLLKLALATFILTWKEWDESPVLIRSFITIVGCAPIPGNLKAAKGN